MRRGLFQRMALKHIRGKPSVETKTPGDVPIKPGESTVPWWYFLVLAGVFYFFTRQLLASVLIPFLLWLLLKKA